MEFRPLILPQGLRMNEGYLLGYFHFRETVLGGRFTFQRLEKGFIIISFQK